MKYKTAELEGALLDAAVAKAEGWEYRIVEQSKPWVYLCDGPTDGGKSGVPLTYAPSTDWAIGGPIIQRERISVVLEKYDDSWWAGLVIDTGYETNARHRQWGATPLIAAMRTYVASKFGEEVELP